MDAPATLPEETVLDLVVDDEGDDLARRERAGLHGHLGAEDVLAELREKT